MGWEDRDWARHTDEELRRLYGRTPGGPVSRLERDVGAGWALLAVAVILGGAYVALHALGARQARVPLRPALPVPALVIDAPAAPAPSGPRPWPGGTVRFANEAPDQEWAVRQAAAAWNASGALVHFVETSPSDADVVIVHTPTSSCTHADATLGDVPGARIEVFPLNDSDPACTSYAAALALAHEFGHVLGLGHTMGECSLMNPSGSYRGPHECVALDPWLWDCRMLEPGDVQRTIALYGGVSRLGTERGCPLYTAIAPPSGLRLVAASPEQTAATFVRPAEPAAPSFLGANAGESSYSAEATLGACPGRPSGQRFRWSGGSQTADFGAKPPGIYCIEVWAYDGLGRPSVSPASLTVDLTG